MELEDVCKVIKDKPVKFNANKRYYSTGSIETGKTSAFDLVAYDKRPSRANVYPKLNDVGFAVMKGTNKVVYINEFLEGSIFSTGFSFLRSAGKINPKYLFYLIKNERFQNIKDKKSVDGIMGGIRKSDILKIKIPLPPLEVQEQIVTELDNYQKIIDGARQVVENYKPTFKINPDWEIVDLGELINFVSGLTLSIPECEDKNGTPILAINNVTASGEITLNGLRKIRLPKKKTINFIQQGDLLFNWRNGSKHLVGKTAYFDLDGKYVFASFLLGIRTKREVLEPKYLWYLLNAYRKDGKYMQFMRQNVNGLFNREELKILKIDLPSLTKQREIVSQFDRERKLVETTKDLIMLFEQKIKDRISDVWGEK